MTTEKKEKVQTQTPKGDESDSKLDVEKFLEEQPTDEDRLKKDKKLPPPEKSYNEGRKYPKTFGDKDYK